MGYIVAIAIAVVDYLPQIPAFFAAIPETIQQNLNVIIPLGIAVGVLGSQYLFAKGAMIATSIVSKAQAFWTGVLTAKQWLLNAALTANPICLFIALIAGLVAAIIIIKKRTEEWAKSFKAVGTILKVSAKLMWENLKHSSHMIWFSQKMLWLRFKQFGQYLKDLFQNIGKSIKLALQFDFSGAKKALTAPIKTAAEAEIEELKKQLQKAVNEHRNVQIGCAKEIIQASKDISIKFKKTEADKQEEAIKKKAEVLTQAPKTPAVNMNSGASTANSIATGGRKQTILNVHIEKVLETVSQHISEGKEGADELVDTILDELTRRLHGTFKSAGV